MGTYSVMQTEKRPFREHYLRTIPGATALREARAKSWFQIKLGKCSTEATLLPKSSPTSKKRKRRWGESTWLSLPPIRTLWTCQTTGSHKKFFDAVSQVVGLATKQKSKLILTRPKQFFCCKTHRVSRWYRAGINHTLLSSRCHSYMYTQRCSCGITDWERCNPPPQDPCLYNFTQSSSYGGWLHKPASGCPSYATYNFEPTSVLW